jgi:hypothetical protein
LWAAVEQHFHESNHAGVVDFNAGYFALARREGKRQLLKQGKIDMDVEEFGFQAGETIRNHHQLLAEGAQILQWMRLF